MSSKVFFKNLTFSYVVLGTVFLTIVPAILFSLVEGWSFLDSWYFTIISLTTIGFGDYAPSYITEKGFLSIYRVMALCWLLIGLSWLGGLLRLVDSIRSLVFKLLENRLKV